MRGLPVLAGKKCTLRPFEPKRDRARAHFRWRNDHQVMHWHYLHPRTELRDERMRIQRLIESQDDWAWDIFAREAAPGQETHVGYLVLHIPNHAHRHGEFAITVGERAYWGRGIGREAIALLLDRAFSKEGGLHRVFLNVAALNERGLRCYRALGFVEEGRKREHLLVDGKWVDDLTMSVLDREWLVRHALAGTGRAERRTPKETE